MGKAKDLTGLTFGHLTVLERTDDYISPKGYRAPRWLCECDCGKRIVTHGTLLVNGKTKSCGHTRKGRKTKRNDLVGKVFGHLTVIKDDGTRNRQHGVMWLCQCDCGKRLYVSTSQLNSGNTKSCGHPGTERLVKYNKVELAKVPGTRLDSLGDKANKNNKLGERNISIVRTKYHGQPKRHDRYRVSVMYKRKQYGGVYESLKEAIEAREKLREKYWPNYGGSKNDKN